MEPLESASMRPGINDMVRPGPMEESVEENNLQSGLSQVSHVISEFVEEEVQSAVESGETSGEKAEKIKQLAAEIKEKMRELEETIKEITSSDKTLEEITGEKNQMEQIINAEADGAEPEELLGGGHVVGLSNAVDAISDKVSVKAIYEEKFSTEGDHSRGNA